MLTTFSTLSIVVVRAIRVKALVAHQDQEYEPDTHNANYNDPTNYYGRAR